MELLQSSGSSFPDRVRLSFYEWRVKLAFVDEVGRICLDVRISFVSEKRGSEIMNMLLAGAWRKKDGYGCKTSLTFHETRNSWPSKLFDIRKMGSTIHSSKNLDEYMYGSSGNRGLIKSYLIQDGLAHLLRPLIREVHKQVPRLHHLRERLWIVWIARKLEIPVLWRVISCHGQHMQTHDIINNFLVFQWLFEIFTDFLMFLNGLPVIDKIQKMQNMP